ncbi:Tol-Pal system beta propeller repeat protein TolB [Marinicella gelatinilytica]|uniref:Tol-Pal system beta propeller repeat protein TolB n=1 Tax=Marinicella gelatinilytica TaxID=2996017 RepID=UPI002260DD71|nr:Tol-Pal system beta propeller repeat protein TolB [Marinicella gelatinilytica]MCX7545369.1 Tol-Pal system beta propeller repeat protein TolB [Marinicella gelatinilytica]
MRKIFAFIFLIGSHNAFSQLNITIDGGSATAIPIAITDFVYADGPLSTDISEVIRNDLARSGQFKPLNKDLLVEHPGADDDINIGTWRMLKADYLAYASIQSVGVERIEIRFRLTSVAEQKQLLALTLPIKTDQLRAGAHFIADKIYQEILGIPGAFSTKLAYVTVSENSSGIHYQLMVADADGYNPQSLVTSKEPLMSPAWSPDRQKLAYVSFEQGGSAIYLQNLKTGERTLMASFKGINSAPKFSPDGRHLAVTLSKGGNPDIYSIDLASKAVTQLTTHWAIDTEPEWSQDGRQIFFTSDRGGKPHIYQIEVASKDVSRVTFEGDYNARASLSPDQTYIALVHGNNNNFKIGLLHRPSGTLQLLSKGSQDESPTFAPNGSMVLYATKNNKNQGVLRAVSLDGQTTNDLILSDGSVREPAWSPLN